MANIFSRFYDPNTYWVPKRSYWFRIRGMRIDNYLWLDLEMTGLDPTRDLILEVAAIVTDVELNEIASFEAGVGHDGERVAELLTANPFYSKMKDNKQALIELGAKSAPSTVVEGQLVDFINQHCGAIRPVVLAGNSIHMDRLFIRAYWPRVEQLLHYRMLDVTSWKLLFEPRGIKHDKQEAHRALGDIRESIDELKTYLKRVNFDGAPQPTD